MDYPSTRAAAKAAGATHYFTGQPCARGHIAPRKTKGVCVECMKEDWATSNARRAEMPKSEAARAAGRRYYEKNMDLVKARANNQSAEALRQYKRDWESRNPDYVQANVNARRRRQKNAYPKWVTPEHKAQIRALYLAARKLSQDTGVPYVVDHIVPLRSEVVCGLHVPWNLRIITREANLQKSNRLLED